MKFIDTTLCTGGKWCEKCRSDPRFRALILRDYEVPPGAPDDKPEDWPCPPERGAKPFIEIGLPRPKVPPKPRQRKFGPGSLVKTVLAGMGYTQKPGCGCTAMAARMNSWGWRGTLGTHRAETLAWFIAKAREAGLDVTSDSVWSLLRAGAKDVLRRRFGK